MTTPPPFAPLIVSCFYVTCIFVRIDSKPLSHQISAIAITSDSAVVIANTNALSAGVPHPWFGYKPFVLEYCDCSTFFCAILRCTAGSSRLFPGCNSCGYPPRFPKSKSPRSIQLSIGTTFASQFMGEVFATSTQHSPLVTSQWWISAIGLICFTAVLKLQLFPQKFRPPMQTYTCNSFRLALFLDFWTNLVVALPRSLGKTTDLANMQSEFLLKQTLDCLLAKPSMGPLSGASQQDPLQAGQQSRIYS